MHKGPADNGWDGHRGHGHQSREDNPAGRRHGGRPHQGTGCIAVVRLVAVAGQHGVRSEEDIDALVRLVLVVAAAPLCPRGSFDYWQRQEDISNGRQQISFKVLQLVKDLNRVAPANTKRPFSPTCPTFVAIFRVWFALDFFPQKANHAEVIFALTFVAGNGQYFGKRGGKLINCRGRIKAAWSEMVRPKIFNRKYLSFVPK